MAISEGLLRDENLEFYELMDECNTLIEEFTDLDGFFQRKDLPRNQMIIENSHMMEITPKIIKFMDRVGQWKEKAISFQLAPGFKISISEPHPELLVKHNLDILRDLIKDLDFHKMVISYSLERLVWVIAQNDSEQRWEKAQKDSEEKWAQAQKDSDNKWRKSLYWTIGLTAFSFIVTIIIRG
ncbi:MAG: hypothetical protein KAR42_04160 [candidate division Zixibacteria bacterium]|nr:hypothetical protein [candidate division Zixibacteria bacterium]